MTKRPLSITQANHACSDYQYLSGKKFNNDIATIICVAVAPYDEVNQYIFMLQYSKHEDAIKALEIYEGTEFDVIILGKMQLGKNEFVCTGLDNYLSENGIPFDLVDYLE